MLGAGALGLHGVGRAQGPGAPPAPSRNVQGPAAAPNSSLLLTAVTEVFQSMKQTRYQHQIQVDEAAGLYDFDSVGMVTVVLGIQTAPAQRALLEGLGIRRGFVPAPARYVEWFHAAGQERVPFWGRVPRIADMLPGDIIAWVNEPNNPRGDGSTVGHALIAAGSPLPLSDGSFAVLIYDSTASFHGPFDTRRSDPRNLPLEIAGSSQFGTPSGLGRGTIQLIPDATGAPAASAWSVGTRPLPNVIEIGRVIP
jgi:hypothetical protein